MSKKQKMKVRDLLSVKVRDLLRGIVFVKGSKNWNAALKDVGDFKCFSPIHLGCGDTVRECLLECVETYNYVAEVMGGDTVLELKDGR